MGACLSAAGGATEMMIENGSGGEEEFHKRYLEDRVLGEGEFGVVKLVHDMTADKSAPPLACKTLRKGVVFKDNVLHAPLKPEILKGEIAMLRKLNGECYNLKLVSIYETKRLIYMITELCSGGEMMEYVAQRSDDLHTEDVSRIAYQLLSSLDHCAKHHVIHRDLKPENIMFIDNSPKAEIRVIDFGSGVLDDPATVENPDDFGKHTTFAGTAFYISPEMFQKNYTQRTDVWSAGVVLYVLVAGYPADQLQKAFNLLQKSKRDLKTLPNMPPDLPEMYYDMLNGLLVYRHQKRKSAAEMLQHEFVTFHKELEAEAEDDVADIAPSSPAPSGKRMARKQSIRLEGSVQRHNLMVGYQKFERQVTTLLATILNKGQLEQLIQILDKKLEKKGDPVEQASEGEHKEDDDRATTHEMLDVIPMDDLKSIIKDDIKDDKVLEMLAALPNASAYSTFAYHTFLIQEFVVDAGSSSKKGGSSKDYTNPRQKRRTSGSMRSGSIGAGLGRFSSDDLTSRSDGDSPRRGHSFRGSFRAKRASSPAPRQIKRSNSVKV